MQNKSYIIVGQGLAGSILAYQMYKNGISFKIISDSTIPKASDVAAGLFNPLVFKRLTKSYAVELCLPAMINTYREIEELLNQSFLVEKQMLKPLSEQESELWQVRAKQPDFEKYITNITEKQELSGLHHFYKYGIVNHTGNLKLGFMLHELQKWFTSNDWFIDAPFTHEDLIIKADSVEWNGIQANGIIFCEGVKVQDNPWFDFIHLRPVKGELLEIVCEELPEEYILNKRLFVLPVGNHHFKIGATYDWQNLNHQTTKEAEEDLCKRFKELVNLPYAIVNHWAGIRPTVSDRRPLLGTHPEHKQLHIFNGLGTKGVLLAPWFALQMVNYLLRDDYKLPAEADVSRFWKE